MQPSGDNPMGSHALRLSNPTVLIHGTDRPWGIGTRDSHGCIRLYQEDIARLFGMVRIWTPASIVTSRVDLEKIRKATRDRTGLLVDVTK